MDIKIQAVHFKADQKLIQFCEKKLSKLDQYYDGIISAEVFLKLEKDDERENKIVEVTLSVPSVSEVFAKKKTKTFEESTDLVVDALRRQLEKVKEKTRAK